VRFDPRLVQPDAAPLDVAGEIDLPDDLVELAGQLRDDAEHLAALYPASAAAGGGLSSLLTSVPVSQSLQEPIAIPVRSPNRDWRRAAFFVGTACSILGLAVMAAPHFWRDEARSTAVVETPAGVQATGAGATAAAPVLAETVVPVSADVPGLLRDSARPSLLLHGVSGPELEGLIDLWQKDGGQETRIEI
jgi:hypothetical protein